MPAGYHDDPMWRVMAEGGPLHANRHAFATHNYMQHVENTGRGWAIPLLRQRHPECFDKQGNPLHQS